MDLCCGILRHDDVAHRFHGFSQNYKSYKSKKGTENKLLIKMIINFL